MKPRIIFMHGNQTAHWSFGWAPWLKNELEKRGYPTFFETMPDSIIARAEYWLEFLTKYACAGSNDVLVGWSTGAVAAMRYAEKHQILGSVLVSPCYTDLGDELEKQSGWYNDPWQWEKIRANQGRIALVYGDDDPYIPQDQFAFISSRLRPTEIKIHAGKHFIERAEFPEVLDFISRSF